MKVFANRFEVTETLRDGTTRRIIRTVYSPIYRAQHAGRIEKCIAALKEANYTDIEFIQTNVAELLITRERVQRWESIRAEFE